MDRTAAPFLAAIPATPDSDGEQLAYSNGGYFYQVLSATLAPQSVYTVRVDVGDRSDPSFPGASIRLGYGSVLGANLLAPQRGVNPTPNFSWETWQCAFATGIAPAGEALRIELVDPGGSAQVLFDNVRIDVTVVPEPSSLALALLALGAIGLRRVRA